MIIIKNLIAFIFCLSINSHFYNTVTISIWRYFFQTYRDIWFCRPTPSIHEVLLRRFFKILRYISYHNITLRPYCRALGTHKQSRRLLTLVYLTLHRVYSAQSCIFGPHTVSVYYTAWKAKLEKAAGWVNTLNYSHRSQSHVADRHQSNNLVAITEE